MSGASSLDSVLASPLTAPRMLLLRVSPLIGCLTLVEAMKRIAAASDRRSAGSAAWIRCTALMNVSWWAA